MTTCIAGQALGGAARVRGLYVITATVPERGVGHADVARSALAGGCRVVQFRDKEADDESFLREAAVVRELCRRHGATFIVNDRADAAMELRADGLHVGQGDLDQIERWLPTWDALLGISVSSLEETAAAYEVGAHYIGAGPVFPTPSKEDAVSPIGLEGLAEICSSSRVPVAAIGGITVERVADVIAAGAHAVCVISAVSAAPDPRLAAAALASACESALSGLAAHKGGL